MRIITASHPMAGDKRDRILTKQRLMLSAAMAAPAVHLGPARLVTETTAPADTQRAVYHLTPTSGWLSDPQRPVIVGGTTNLYYLSSALDNGPGGWRHVTTSDNAVFTDQGTAIPLSSRFPVWTGSSVVDTNNTAGFGAGAVVALATQPTDGDAYKLLFIAKGFTVGEIANMLHLSAHTVATHVKHIYRKLAVHSRTEAVFEAGRMGLL